MERPTRLRAKNHGFWNSFDDLELLKKKFASGHSRRFKFDKHEYYNEGIKPEKKKAKHAQQNSKSNSESISSVTLLENDGYRPKFLNGASVAFDIEQQLHKIEMQKWSNQFGVQFTRPPRGNDETMITYPQNGHHRDSTGILNSEVEAKQIQRYMNQSCQRADERPRQAYQGGSSETTSRFAVDGDMQNQVEVSLPNYKKACRSLYRHAEKNIIATENLYAVPLLLRLTFRGRHAPAGSRYENESGSFIAIARGKSAYFDVRERFRSRKVLEKLYQSEIWKQLHQWETCRF